MLDRNHFYCLIGLVVLIALNQFVEAVFLFRFKHKYDGNLALSRLKILLVVFVLSYVVLKNTTDSKTTISLKGCTLTFIAVSITFSGFEKQRGTLD